MARSWASRRLVRWAPSGHYIKRRLCASLCSTESAARERAALVGLHALNDHHIYCFHMRGEGLTIEQAQWRKGSQVPAIINISIYQYGTGPPVNNPAASPAIHSCGPFLYELQSTSPDS